MDLKLKGGGKHECFRLHEYIMIIYVGVWFDLHWYGVEYFCHTMSLHAVKVDIILWLNHFNQWRVLEGALKLQ